MLPFIESQSLRTNCDSLSIWGLGISMPYDGSDSYIFDARLSELANRIQSRSEKTIWSGARVPSRTALNITGEKLVSLSDKNQNRDELLESIPTLSEEAAFIATMAWGGQKKDHTIASWEERDKWLKILYELRTGVISPVKAYEQFQQAEVKGLGPAFYTKLIFFLQNEKYQRAYIMDQWTAKSMELLCVTSNSAPKLKWISITQKQSNGIPFMQAALARGNMANAYEYYCNFVHELQRQLAQQYSIALTGDEVEEAIFAGGPRRQPPLPWRHFTMTTWKNRYSKACQTHPTGCYSQGANPAYPDPKKKPRQTSSGGAHS